jgi:hypothetical protein
MSLDCPIIFKHNIFESSSYRRPGDVRTWKVKLGNSSPFSTGKGTSNLFSTKMGYPSKIVNFVSRVVQDVPIQFLGTKLINAISCIEYAVPRSQSGTFVLGHPVQY